MRYLNLLFLLVAFHSLAQPIAVTEKSDFTHDYALGRFEYIENLKDTARLKYIATLKVTVPHTVQKIITVVDRLKTKSKDLGANCFYLHSSTQHDSTITLTIRSYFGYDNFFDLNNKNKSKEKVFVFSNLNKQNEYQYFFINDSSSCFLSTEYFTFTPQPKTSYELKGCSVKKMFFEIVTKGSAINSGGTPALIVKGKEGKDSRFIIIYSEGLISADKINSAERRRKTGCGIASESYSYSRILLELYKPGAN